MAPPCCWPAAWRCGGAAVAELNLLPWREAARATRRRQFLGWLWVLVLAVVLLLYAGDHYVNKALARQGQRNAALQAQIVALDKAIDEGRQLQARIDTLSGQVAALRSLAQTSSQVVHLLEVLVHTLPPGLYYDSLSRSGDSLTLIGVSESPQQVSVLMRALERSPWFGAAELRQVSAMPDAAATVEAANPRHRFQLELTLAAIPAAVPQP